MGMDVYGLAPRSPIGQSFRANVWHWRPLWDYTRTVMPDIGSHSIDDRTDPEAGHFNDGWGINAAGADELAFLLREEMESGRTGEMRDAYYAHLATMERVPCRWCNSTGIRTDAVGVEYGYPTMTLDPIIASVVGRTHGSCNACDGIGSREHDLLAYRFEIETVEEWQRFVAECGGFRIL